MSWPNSRPASSIESAVDPLGELLTATPFDDADRWERRGELAAGGMGVVAIVFDRWLDREIAVKAPSTEQDAARLFREARITASLDHPGIVSVFDAGRSPRGEPWFTMRLVRGRSLADTFAELEADAPTEPLIRHVLAAAEAVAYAHSRKVIHRDLKPGNIMVGPFGETQVIDWGLALDGNEQTSGADGARGTQGADGPRAGTASSMSPEQARREPIDRRADVYALGLILMQAVTRRPPFPASMSRDAILAELVAGRVPTLPRETPVQAELRAIIACATDRDPQRRYPDAKAFADDLARYLDGRRVAAHNYSAREMLTRLIRLWRVPLALSAVALVVIGIVIYVGFERVAQERDVSELTLGRALVDHARAALHRDDRGAAEILAREAVRRGDFPEARGVLLAAPSSRPVRVSLETGDCSAIDVAWAADGPPLTLCQEPGRLSVHRGRVLLWERELATRGAIFIDHGKLVLAQPDGGRVERLDARTGETLSSFEPTCRYGNLAPASDRRFGLIQHHACAYDIDANTTRPLPIDGCGGFLRIATTSRDHRLFAAACGDGSLLVGRLDRDSARATVGADVERGVRRIDARLPVAPERPLPTALELVDEETILVGDSDGGVTLLDLERPRTRRRVVPHAAVIRRVLVSADGRRAVVRYEDGPVYVVDIASFASLGRLPPRAGPSYQTAGITPDGHIYATSPGRLEHWDFSKMRARELFFPEGLSDLALSPDGGTLAVSHGAAVSIVEVATRTITKTWSWQRELVRTLTFSTGRSAGYRLAVGTLGLNGLHVFEGEGRIDLPYNRLMRKVVALGSSAFLASDFGRRLSIFEIIGPPTQGPEVTVEDHHVSPDGKHLAILDTSQRVWVATDWSPRSGLIEVGRWVGARRVARLDEASVFVLDRDGLTELPAEAMAAPRMRYLAGGPELGALAVSPRVLAASARDGSVHLWRRGEARAYAVIRDLERRVDEVVLAPDGSWLVAGDWTGRMLFMDTDTRGPGGLAEAERAWGLTLDDLVPEAR